MGIPSICIVLILGILVILCLADAVSYAQTTGLALRKPIAYWKFDEVSGTTAADYSGNNHVAALSGSQADGSQWITGRLGGGLLLNRLNTTEDLVTVADQAELNFTNHKSFSLAIWVRSRGPQVDYASIVCKGGLGHEQFALDLRNGDFRFFVRTADKGALIEILTDVSPNGRWQNLVATYDGAGTMAFYIDGKKRASVALPQTSLLSNSQPIQIGSRGSKNGTGRFTGVIDDLRIYDDALTDVEVQALYAAAGTFSPVVYIQPQDCMRHYGENVDFPFLADGTEPLSFQWQKDTRNIADATNMVLRLNNLRPEDAGIYVLRIANPFGAIVTPGVVLTMRPLFWQTKWFLIACVLAFTLGGGGIVLSMERRKSRAALERIQRANAVERERMRIARDMHDQVGASVTQIGLLGERAKRDAHDVQKMTAYAERICLTARGLGQTLDEIVWAVDPKNDTLDKFVGYIALYAEEFFEMTDIRCRIDVAPDMPAHPLSSEVRHDLFLAVKESLNNIIKHAQATEVWIRFSVTAALFQLSIEDDGKGFSAEPVDGFGNGLQNMNSRLKEINGTFQITHAPPSGTKVRFMIPLDKDLKA